MHLKISHLIPFLGCLTDVRSTRASRRAQVSVCLALWLYGICSGCVGQNKAQNFFEASVPVRSQSEQELQAAAKKGLREVLVRMSGNRQVLRSAQLQEAVDRAQSFVVQFQYHSNSDRQEYRAGKRQRIRLVYSASAVQSLLRKSGQPFWPVNRPTTLVWLVIDHPQNGRQFVPKSATSSLIKSLEDAANRRGVPLIYPLYDLEDRILISEDKLWSVDEQAIQAASRRYEADAVMVGRISKTSSGHYISYWEFFHDSRSNTYDSRSDSIIALGRQALTPVADYFAARYAIKPRGNEAISGGESPTLAIQVAGVKDFAAYRKTLDYLESMASISGVSLAAVRRDTVLIFLQSDSSLTFFENTIRLDNKLISETETYNINSPAQQQVPRGTTTNPLQYRWAG